MSKMNLNNSKKLAESYGTKRQLSLKLERRDIKKATDKQKAYMLSLEIPFSENVTKRQAMHLISSTLEKARELESKMRREYLGAMERDGNRKEKT